ncbi:hypothetical protein GCM10022225_21540 [Plantactinospora mayteni]|uniref:Uncharacterized protein n=1 Tax=Plantactinospora mayteni TaxID=566021 RepID=A0ABQ4ENZ4_9ACTN|nr:hypothetical protein [Plantactinospora mayteni]GIG96335.1 hypothetical protein Pma05_29080 [Plantactinospora mayteni]
MKARLLRGFAATALALAVVLPGSTQPAHADPDDTNASLIDMIDLALNLVGRASSGGITPALLLQMTQDVISALDQAEAEVIAHIDAIASAEIRGATRAAVIEFADINNLADETLEDWAQQVTHDAIRAGTYLDAVADLRAVDDIGYAAITVYPIALVARARAGFGTTSLRTQYKNTLQRLVDRLTPTCDTYLPDPRIPVIRVYECRVYGSHTASYTEYHLNGAWDTSGRAAVQAEASANTSRQVAVEVLNDLP